MAGTVSRTLGAHAEPLAVEHGGKVYQARPITQKVKSAFERWLQARVLEPVQAMASADPAMMPALSLVMDRIDAGHYSYHGERSLKALQTPDGFLALTALVFSITVDDALALTAAKPVEVGNVMAQTIRDSFPDAKPRGEQDPNAPGPAGE